MLKTGLSSDKRSKVDQEQSPLNIGNIGKKASKVDKNAIRSQIKLYVVPVSTLGDHLHGIIGFRLQTRQPASRGPDDV